MSRSTKRPVNISNLLATDLKLTVNIYLLHDISELYLVQFSISFALLTHFNQHWDDLLPDNLRARGVQIWEEVLHRRSAVGHEWGNVSIWPSPAILPFVLLVPNSPAAPSSTVVPVLISPRKSSASILAVPTSVVIHLGLGPVEVVLLLHWGSKLVRMLLLVDPPPNLRTRGVSGGVMIDVSPAEETID